MNVLIAGLKDLVRSFDSNQRQKLKDTVGKAIDSYLSVPSFVAKLIKGKVDGAIDKFLDDSE